MHVSPREYNANLVNALSYFAFLTQLITRNFLSNWENCDKYSVITGQCVSPTAYHVVSKHIMRYNTTSHSIVSHDMYNAVYQVVSYCMLVSLWWTNEKLHSVVLKFEAETGTDGWSVLVTHPIGGENISLDI